MVNSHFRIKRHNSPTSDVFYGFLFLSLVLAVIGWSDGLTYVRLWGTALPELLLLALLLPTERLGLEFALGDGLLGIMSVLSPKRD